MSSRLNLAPENDLIQTTARLRSDLDDLKSRQSVARKLVRRTYSLSTNATFDVSGDPVPAYKVRLYRLTMIGTAVQANPYGVQYSQVYNNGVLLSDRTLTDSTGAYYTWYSGPASFDPNRMDWTISFVAGSSAASVSIKIRVLSTTKASNLYLTW